MCFETALVLAFLSKRCLVTPKAYRLQDEPEWDESGYRPLHPQESFDLEVLNTIVDVIPYGEYGHYSAAGALGDTVDLVLEPGTAVFCFPAIPAADTLEAARLEHFAAGRRHFVELTPEMQACHTLNVKTATLEHFYWFFYFSRVQDEQECKRLVKQHVRFKSEIIATAARIAASLGDYGAVHVRRNDFFRQYAEQDIPASQLLGKLAAWLPRGSRLYVATDEPDK